MDSTIYWIGFNFFVLIMLALDLGIFHRKIHVISVKEALIWSFIWIALAILFNAGILYLSGKQKALEFLTGYLIEKSLSIDNIFVFVLIFSYFKVPTIYQHKILLWGVVGALVMRAIFIAAGLALLEHFHWIIYVFGGFLVFTGIKMLTQKDKEIHPEKNPVLRFVKRFVKLKPEYSADKFFIRENGVRYATPLFVVLIFIETTDLIFAVDSIPAIIAVSKDPFIVYTSNVFAILGLRSLYFALAGIIEKFRYLSYGLSIILIFVGIKMTITDFYKIPIIISLAVILIILSASILISLWRDSKERGKALNTSIKREAD